MNSIPSPTHLKLNASELPSTNENRDCMSQVRYSNATMPYLSHYECVMTDFGKNTKYSLVIVYSISQNEPKNYDSKI